MNNDQEPEHSSKTQCSQGGYEIAWARYQHMGPVNPIMGATLWYDNSKASDLLHDVLWRQRLQRSVAHNVKIGLIKPEEGERMLETMTSMELDKFLYKLEKANSLHK